MKQFLNKDKKGFTLIELLVVISIIGIFTAVTTVSFSAARSSARDKARMSDIASLQQGLRLYAEESGYYPEVPGGVAIGSGGSVDSLITQYFNRIPVDAMSGDGVHEYWYDSQFACNGADHVVVMATEMETANAGNYVDICGSSNSPGPFPGSNGSGGDNDTANDATTYIMVLD